MKGPDEDEGLSSLAKADRAAAPWLNVVWQFTGSVIVGVGAGWGIDRWAGSSPWGLIIGGMVGSGIGLYAFIRSSNRLLKTEKKDGK
ncbi:MAG: AtpZ/AtpI family protein [Archangium sp.]